MVTENTTPNRGYQEPAVGNTLEVDVGRLIAALRAIDTDVASALASIVAKAGLNSPAFTGTPTAPTAAPGTDSGQLATTAFVRAAVAALVDSSPGALDTLNELAAALGDDPNFAATMTALIGTKADDAATAAALAGKADAATAVTLTGTQTLTNKTLTGPAVNNPTLVLKQSSNPTPTAEGAVEWDTDDNAIVVGDGVGSKVFRTYELIRSAPIAASGQTSILFTDIPAWAREINIDYILLSTNGTSNLGIMLGDAGGVENTGYSSTVTTQSGGTAGATASFAVANAVVAAATFCGSIKLRNPNGNTWVLDGNLVNTNGNTQFSSGGVKTLSDVLTQISITTGGGTDTFDSGSVAISCRP